jgi:hypothetical protein
MYIDKTGKRLFDNQVFTAATSFSGGMAVVEKTTKAGSAYLQFIDSTGKAIADAAVPGYGVAMKLEFRGFHEGLAAIKNGRTNKWGYVNIKGKWAIQPEADYKEVGDFHEGLAVVQEATTRKWGVIGSKGELVIPFIYDNRPSDFSEGLSAIRNDEDKIGYMDKTGNVIIPFQYDGIVDRNGLPFIGGNTVVLRDGFYYTMSNKGVENQRIGELSAEVRMLENGLVTFKKWTKAEHWGIGLMRTNGAVLFPPGDLVQLGESGNGLMHARADIHGLMVSGFVNMESNFVILNQNK